MNSLRFRLALLSSVLSMLVIVVPGVLSSLGMVHLLRESVRLRLKIPIDRLLRDLHPHLDNRSAFAYIERAYGEEIAAGNLLMLARQRGHEEPLFQSPPEAWPEILPEAFWKEEVSEKEPEGPSPEFDDLTDLFFPAPPRRPPGEERHNPGSEEGPGPGAEGHRRELRDRLPPPPTQELSVDYHNAVWGGKRWIFGVARQHGFTVLMAQPLSRYDSEVRRIMILFGTAVPVCLFFVGGAGWFIAHRALRPVRSIAETARHISTSALQERIPVTTPRSTEMDDLITILNDMMDRLERGFLHATRFSADVSHELKTPLAIMQGTIETALKDCEPGSREETNLLSIGQECQRLKSITRSLLLLSQADSGHLPVHRQEVPLSEEIAELCEDAAILCEPMSLTLEKEIAPDLVLHTDPVLLRQALRNLVSNAVKYNRRDGTVRCSLRTGSEGSTAVFEISNTGPGIPDEDRNHIFERFYRADKARSREVDGFGLGLNLAREILRALDGDLQLVESTDQETRFRVILPLTPGSTPNPT